MADKKKKQASKKLYKMPEKITKGEIIKDNTKVSWIIGNSIGVGGFGEIYVAAKSTEPTKLLYAVKIEPIENGPLFCERTAYINFGKKNDIDEFLELRKLKYLGLPAFYGFGRHTFKNIEYRFIVIEKLGKDIVSLLNPDGTMPYATILKIGIQILHVLEYMHSKGYVHCDIKGANLLLGESKGKENHVHVVDFGLACKYATTFEPNPKKAHNGTPEYLSCDAHKGLMTRRGDIEVLAYNLLHWATGHLPWAKLTNCQEIQAKKEAFIKDPEKLLAACYKTDTPDFAIKAFFAKVSKTDAMDEPDYKVLHGILSLELKKMNANTDVLEFGIVKEAESPVKKTRASRKKPLANGDGDKDTPKRKKAKPVLSETDNNEIEDKQLRRSPRNKKTVPEVEKRSWKDCPTVVNGTIKPRKPSPEKKSKRK